MEQGGGSLASTPTWKVKRMLGRGCQSGAAFWRVPLGCWGGTGDGRLGLRVQK